MRILDPQDPEDAKLIAAEPDAGQCARCGSSVFWEHCPECEDGYVEFDFGDDVVPQMAWRLCDVCDGDGGFWLCISSAEFCQSNPIPGREGVTRGTIETFDVSKRTESE